MISFKTSTLLIATSILMLGVTGQKYYPGGLGNSSLFLWLNANNSASITAGGTGKVSKWNDLSGSGLNFTQATSSLQPIYNASGNPDGNPGIQFSATSTQYLSLASFPSSIGFTNGISFFAQASFGGTSTNWGWQRIFDFGNGQATDNFEMGRYGNAQQTYWEGWSGTNGDQTFTQTATVPIVNNDESLYEVIQTAGAAGTKTSVAQWAAGVSQAVAGQAGTSITWIPSALTRTKNYLGKSNWASDNYLTGSMSELLFYNVALNATQRVILENYLGASWNQTVSVRKYTPPGVLSYSTNLVGIGYTSATDNFLADVTGSTDGLGFSSGTGATDFLKSAGYIMGAHDGQNATVITNATVPGIHSSSSLSRWNRSWYVMHSGGNTAGSVTFSFNSQDYNGSNAFNTGGTFALLFNSTDGTFASGFNQLISTTPSSVSTSNISFKVTASSLATGYYTILYTTTPVTLPVTLNSFTAIAQGNSALLQWSTSEQSAFNKFSVQRSADGTSFSPIGSIAGTANSTNVEQYSYTDNDPLPGTNYYRLAMIDLDGTTSWSTIRSVSFGASGGAPAVTLYPNPVVSQLHVVLTDMTGAATIRLLNSEGQVVRTTTAVAPATVDMTVNGLAAGIYMLTVDGTNGQHFVRGIIKD